MSWGITKNYVHKEIPVPIGKFGNKDQLFTAGNSGSHLFAEYFARFLREKHPAAHAMLEFVMSYQQFQSCDQDVSETEDYVGRAWRRLIKTHLYPRVKSSSSVALSLCRCLHRRSSKRSWKTGRVQTCAWGKNELGILKVLQDAAMAHLKNCNFKNFLKSSDAAQLLSQAIELGTDLQNASEELSSLFRRKISFNAVIASVFAFEYYSRFLRRRYPSDLPIALFLVELNRFFRKRDVSSKTRAELQLQITNRYFSIQESILKSDATSTNQNTTTSTTTTTTTSPLMSAIARTHSRSMRGLSGGTAADTKTVAYLTSKRSAQPAAISTDVWPLRSLALTHWVFEDCDGDTHHPGQATDLVHQRLEYLHAICKRVLQQDFVKQFQNSDEHLALKAKLAMQREYTRQASSLSRRKWRRNFFSQVDSVFSKAKEKVTTIIAKRKNSLTSVSVSLPAAPTRTWSWIHRLPDEMVTRCFFAMMQPRSLALVQMTSRRMYSLGCADWLWRRILYSGPYLHLNALYGSESIGPKSSARRKFLLCTKLDVKIRLGMSWLCQQRELGSDNTDTSPKSFLNPMMRYQLRPYMRKLESTSREELSVDFNVLVIGARRSGKTTLCSCYTNQTASLSPYRYAPSNGLIRYPMVEDVAGVHTNITLWEKPFPRRHDCINNSLFRRTNGVLVAVNLQDPDCLSDSSGFLRSVCHNLCPGGAVALVAMHGLPFASAHDAEKIFFSPVESFIPLRAALDPDVADGNAEPLREADDADSQSEADNITQLRAMAKKYKALFAEVHWNLPGVTPTSAMECKDNDGDDTSAAGVATNEKEQISAVIRAIVYQQLLRSSSIELQLMQTDSKKSGLENGNCSVS